MILELPEASYTQGRSTSQLGLPEAGAYSAYAARVKGSFKVLVRHAPQNSYSCFRTFGESKASEGRSGVMPVW